MDARDTVKLAAVQLGEKKVRTALTIIMVIIGVASIVALTSQTAGESQSIQKSLGSLGPTAILVSPSGKTLLTSADVAEISSLPNVSSVTPIVTGSGTLTVDGVNQSVTIVGVSTNGLSEIMGNSTFLYQGSLYSDNTTPASAIGYDVAYSSSTEPDVQQVGAGETGTIQTASKSKIAVSIEGVLDEHGTSLISVDNTVFFSLPFAEVLLHKDSYSEILVKATNASSVTALTSLLEVVYGDNARITNTAQLASTFSSITSSTTTLYLIIAGISLLVAAIGIMNVMLMSVSERIHDIGIFKSIGFESKDVLVLFMLQAIFIGFIGGFLGLGTGVAASYAISYAGGLHSGPTGAVTPGSFTGGAGSGSFADRGSSGFAGAGGGGAVFVSSTSGSGGGFESTSSSSPTSSSSSSSTITPVFTLSVILESIAVAVAISIIAGIYPAWKASKMEPIDALRTL